MLYKKVCQKKQKTIDTYSDEYLQKKHGIKIIDPSSANGRSNKTKSKSKMNILNISSDSKK